MNVRRRRLAALLSGAGALLGCARLPAAPLRLAPIGMHPSGEYAATPDGAVTFSGEGSLHLDLYLRATRVRIAVVAAAEGGVVTLEIGLDGTLRAVDLAAKGEVSAEATVARAGVHALSVHAVPHEPAGGPRGMARVRIERVVVWSEA